MFTTHPTLLARVKNGDNVSWYQFRDMYRPLIFHCAEQTGLPGSCFLELEQNVLVAFFNACESFEYDPKKGRFRTYFGSLVRNCIAQFGRDRKRENRLSLFNMDDLAEDAFAKRWEEEWKQHVFWLAMKRAKAELPPKVIDAFELCDLKGVSPCTLAASLKVSLATVYNYRKRALGELRKYVEELNNLEAQE